MWPFSKEKSFSFIVQQALKNIAWGCLTPDIEAGGLQRKPSVVFATSTQVE